MMGIEIKPTNERECTNLAPLILCFALLVTAIGVTLIYGSDNDKSIVKPQILYSPTTLAPLIELTDIPKSIITVNTEASHESTTITSLEPSTTLLPLSSSTLSQSEVITTTTQSSTSQITSEAAVPSENPNKQVIPDVDTVKAVTDTSAGTTAASIKIPDLNIDQTTTIKPDNIIPTSVEGTTLSHEIPMTTATSTTADPVHKHELIPTPQALTGFKRTKRNDIAAATSAAPTATSSAIPTTSGISTTSTASTTSSTSTILTITEPENLPTTTMATVLVTVPLRTMDPTKIPENKFHELTTKGMDATTTTQSSLPTTSIGMETTTKTSFESSSAAPTTKPTTSTPSKANNQGSYEIAWHLVASMSIVSLIFSYIFLVLFGRSAKSVIWIINAALVIFFCSFAGLSEMAGYRIIAILSLITGLILLILMFWYRVRINAVAAFIKECCAVFVDVSSLKNEPLLTIVTITISYIIFYKFFTSIPPDINNKPQVFPLFIIIGTFIWTVQFALSCQHFIISGTVLRWYFNRDKTKPQQPIKSSVFHLIRFHLGSACMGSLLIIFGKIFRIVLFPFRTTEGKQGNCLSNITSMCCIKSVKAFDEVTQYLAPRAYTLVAKDGTPFLKSGKQAYNLVSQRIMDIVALSHYGDIAMFACKILIAVISTVVGYPAIWINTDQKYSLKISLIIGGVFAFIIAHCILMLVEITADTILICFCIDCEENNGVSSSYFMSNELMKSVKDMKESVGGSVDFESKGMATGSSVPMLSHDGHKGKRKRKASDGARRMYD
ncbi:choline transporter-like protein 1 [Chironomus tepperi]|uniref:choline transporter-like protein 1 n=1 Tax=Chironomus tepperi TaxID=113505 RepID=UPI00391F7788